MDMPSLQFKAYHKKLIHSQWQTEICVQRLWQTVYRQSSKQKHSSTPMRYGRQVTFGENPNRWYFQGNWDFRALVAALYQPKVRACAPRHRPLKKNATSR